MQIDFNQAKYALEKIADELPHRERDSAGNEYVARVDANALATLLLLASRATEFDVDVDEIVSLDSDYSTGSTIQSILDYYAS